MRILGVAALAVLVSAGPALAQSSRPSARPASQPSSIGFRAYAIVDSDSIAASKTFDAVFGTSRLTAPGGGVEVVDIWKHLFARVAVTHTHKDGTRVFVSSGQAFPLGIPLSMSMTPIEAGAGWRFPAKPGSRSRVTPYAGGAFISLGYSEASMFAEAGEDGSGRFSGADVFGGAEFGIVKWLVASVEAQYRQIPNAVGGGGASKEFSETDLGGFTVRVTIGIRSKR